MWNSGKFAAVVVIAVSVTVDTAAAQAAVAPSVPMLAPDRAQLERRLESVKTLLETSSAAKQIRASDDATALAEYAKAQKLLLEAPKMLFSAARHVSPEQVTGDKLRIDYLNRRESVSALLNAQKRIAGEKGNVSGAEQVAANVEKLLLEADQLAAAGKYLEARAEADKAYLLARASVGQLRSGDTLVRTLNFANKEEEYKYEHDRNDSLTILFKVLVEQSGSVNPQVAGLLSKGMELRTQAEKVALKGDHEVGVKLLEDSTAQFVRAIRSAGILIPG